ncbi:DUF4097 family beta strand repeat protein [Flavobacteriaceae bacterium R38]|nr:DUF4097 family beta strand repeat protein [Flavobacteriaceae bacterium R38]
MKHLKSTILVIFIVLAGHLNAQQREQKNYTQSLQGVNWVKIEAGTNIVVKTHNKNELLIKGQSYKVPEKAKGLKRINGGGEDNTGIGFYVAKEGSDLIVKNASRRNRDFEIYLPASQNISVNGTWLGDIEIYGFTGEIEAKAESVGNITIEDVTGPIIANSNTGTIQVLFNKVNQSSPISISSATGKLDVSLPSNTSADVSLRSTMGEIYTNFDLKMPDKDGLRAISSQRINGTINKGGVEINLRSSTGNIYLRKQ